MAVTFVPDQQPDQSSTVTFTPDAAPPWDWRQETGSAALMGQGPQAIAAASQVDPWLRAHAPGLMNTIEGAAQWARAHQPFGGAQPSAPQPVPQPAPDYATTLSDLQALLTLRMPITRRR